MKVEITTSMNILWSSSTNTMRLLWQVRISICNTRWRRFEKTRSSRFTLKSKSCLRRPTLKFGVLAGAVQQITWRTCWAKGSTKSTHNWCQHSKWSHRRSYWWTMHQSISRRKWKEERHGLTNNRMSWLKCGRSTWTWVEQKWSNWLQQIFWISHMSIIKREWL